MMILNTNFTKKNMNAFTCICINDQILKTCSERDIMKNDICTCNTRIYDLFNIFISTSYIYNLILYVAIMSQQKFF